MKVLIAISGGMKSLVTAWLLKKQGMQVRGVYLDLIGPEHSQPKIQALERKLGISIQVVPAKAEFAAKFAEAQERAFGLGETLDPGLFFQQAFLFPKLMELKTQHGFTQVATGHRALIQEDQVAKIARVFLNADGDLKETLPLLGRSQTEIASLLLPLGSIPASMFDKLSKELVLEENESAPTWVNDFQGPDSQIEKIFEVFTVAGLRIGAYKDSILPYPGMDYRMPDKSDSRYKIMDVSFQTGQMLAANESELKIEEVNFRDICWFSRTDLGLSPLSCTLVAPGRAKPLLATLLQYEGGRIKAFLNQPLLAEEANIFKGQTMLWVEGTEILGGGRVFGTK